MRNMAADHRSANKEIRRERCPEPSAARDKKSAPDLKIR